MDAAKPETRWFHLTPGRFVLALLAVEVLLWLSERFGWLVWHKGYAVLTAVASVGVALLAMLGWFAVAVMFRRRFQFSLRMLLVMVVVVALPISWLAVEMRAARKYEELVKAIENVAHGGKGVYYDFQIDASGDEIPGATPPGPAWLTNVLEDDFFTDLACVCFCDDSGTDAELERLEGLWQLQRLHLDNTKITDNGLDHLKALTQLRQLSLNKTQITDEGVDRLQAMIQLEKLDLAGTKVTDNGLRYLQGMAHLRRLSLNHTQISDAGLENLHGLVQLKSWNSTAPRLRTLDSNACNGCLDFNSCTYVIPRSQTPGYCTSKG